MSTSAVAEAPIAQPVQVASPTPVTAPPLPRCQVIIEDRVVLPGWVVDLASFRIWANSEDYPNHGWFSYLGGALWVDFSMEELFTHNQVKVAFGTTIAVVLMQTQLGRFVGDGMLLTNAEADLSTEPDGLFFTWSAVQEGRLRFLEGKTGGIMELEGSPELVLEIVSKTSQKKDTETLLDLYFRAGVQEYWLADARGSEPKFNILRRGAERFEEHPGVDGWQTSTVLGREFRLERTVDPLGHALFQVNVRTQS